MVVLLSHIKKEICFRKFILGLGSVILGKNKIKWLNFSIFLQWIFHSATVTEFSLAFHFVPHPFSFFTDMERNEMDGKSF